jgi:V/A-type H+-transporting ATPase subunit I
MALGMIQLMTGVFLDFYRQLKNGDYVDAICDPLAWFVMLLTIVLWLVAGFVGFMDQSVFLIAVYVAAGILVMTQGRKQKIWLLKPIIGILGLYNITAYVSDLLSYSRVMALGLATGVIGFAMNLTAGILGGMMPHPALGFVVAAIVIVCGHGLNFALSLLGAFVHSGRLQFIEFFGKFYEGGGRKFKAFERENKYLFFRN